MVELIHSMEEDDRPGLVAIQEVKADKTQQLTLDKKWNQMGYFTYSQQGEEEYIPGQGKKMLGGVMTAIKKKYQQELVRARKRGNAQEVVTTVEEWEFSNFYAPPRARTELYHLITESVGGQVRGIKKLVTGDWNEEVVGMVAALWQRGGVMPIPISGEYNATRWEGNKIIDWMATNTIGIVKSTGCRGEKISDHKIIKGQLTLTGRSGMNAP